MSEDDESPIILEIRRKRAVLIDNWRRRIIKQTTDNIDGRCTSEKVPELLLSVMCTHAVSIDPSQIESHQVNVQTEGLPTVYSTYSQPNSRERLSTITPVFLTRFPEVSQRLELVRNACMKI